MAQTAFSVHTFIRFGAFEPSFSLHTAEETWAAALLQFGMILPELTLLVPSACLVSRIEFQTAEGEVINGEVVGNSGGYLNAFASFRDCTRFTWESGGEKGPSGMYLHPRPADAYLEGEATVGWTDLVDDFVAAVIAAGFTDSERSAITGLKRFFPSRRRNVRVAAVG